MLGVRVGVPEAWGLNSLIKTPLLYAVTLNVLKCESFFIVISGEDAFSFNNIDLERPSLCEMNIADEEHQQMQASI